MLVRSAYTALWLLDQHFGSRERMPFHKLRKTLHARLTRPNGVPTRHDPVPERRIDYLDAAALRQLESSGPVLFKGLGAQVPAVRHWTLESLAQRCGEMKHPVQRTGSEYYSVENLRLAEVFRDIAAGGRKHAVYGRGPDDILNVHPEIREELGLSSWVDEKALHRPRFLGSNLFASATGHWTPMHSEVGHILSLQVRGSRRWAMYSPARSVELFPEVRGGVVMYTHIYANASKMQDESFGMRGWECVMEEGDVLFCPNYYWHFVDTLSTSVSVANRYMTYRSLARHPVMTALFAKRILGKGSEGRLRPMDAPYEG